MYTVRLLKFLCFRSKLFLCTVAKNALSKLSFAMHCSSRRGLTLANEHHMHTSIVTTQIHQQVYITFFEFAFSEHPVRSLFKNLLVLASGASQVRINLRVECISFPLLLIAHRFRNALYLCIPAQGNRATSRANTPVYCETWSSCAQLGRWFAFTSSSCGYVRASCMGCSVSKGSVDNS